MAKKRKMKAKSHLSAEERKGIKRISRFCTFMHRGLAQADTNDQAWHDMIGAIKVLQRIAIIKRQDTSHIVKTLEHQTTRGPKEGEVSPEAIRDKIKLANTLLAQGMHWDKIDGALVRLHCLCKNEDDILRGQWEFTSIELARPADEDKTADR